MATVLITIDTMTIQNLIENLKKANKLHTTVEKYTLIVNDKSETQGALFFIPIDAKEFKLLLPAPFHTSVLIEDSKPTFLQILMHKEALLLK